MKYSEKMLSIFLTQFCLNVFRKHLQRFLKISYYTNRKNTMKNLQNSNLLRSFYKMHMMSTKWKLVNQNDYILYYLFINDYIRNNPDTMNMHTHILCIF